MFRLKKSLKFISGYTLILAVILTVSIWFYLVDSFRTFQAETIVMLVSHDEKSAALSGQILDNLETLSQRLYFYENVLRDGKGIIDPYHGQSLDEREKSWNNNFEISREGKGTILKLRYFNLDQKKAEQIARQSALTLAKVSSQYYNVKTDADLRIVEEIKAVSVVKNQATLAAVSFGSGTALAFLLAYIFSFFAIRKEQLLTLGAGWTYSRVTNMTFEYVLYPLFIGLWGLKVGGGILMLISLVESFVVIRFYDWTRKDWLGIEAVKSLRDEKQTGKIARLTSWLMKKGDIVALIALSIFSEPIKVTLYMRHGAYQFNGFSKRDWLIFLSSVVIGNVAWALAVFAGIETIREILNFLN